MYKLNARDHFSLQLLSPLFLLTSTTKQMRPNGKGVLIKILEYGMSLTQPNMCINCMGSLSDFKINGWMDECFIPASRLKTHLFHKSFPP